MSRPSLPTARTRDDARPVKRRKEDRKDIWTSLLRQTREAQARNQSTQTVAHRSLVVCGGSPEDQRSFLASVARPPPSTPTGRYKQEDARKAQPRGELKLSNKYAYGYGHVSLFTSPGGIGAAGNLAGLGQEAEEVARIAAHTIPEPRASYVDTMRSLLSVPQQKGSENEEKLDEMTGLPVQEEQDSREKPRRPAIVLLLSWKVPWNFMDELRAWLQFLARSLLPPAAKDEDPIEVLKEFQLKLSIVVQHTEAQVQLERDGWKEERFDYVSQMLRTAILPLNGALVYTSSTAPTQQPGSALTDAQKVVLTALDLDLASLSPPPTRTAGAAPTKKDDLLPRHNVVDRMAICVPAGWDSLGKIRLLSESFSPEHVQMAWQADLLRLAPSLQGVAFKEDVTDGEVHEDGAQTNGAGDQDSKRQEEEVFEAQDSEVEDDDELPSPPMSPSKVQPSAIEAYRSQVEDPNQHKAAPPPAITVEYTPEQTFLAEMKEHLDVLEAQDAEKAKANPQGKQSNSGVSTTGVGRLAGMPAGESPGALNALGDVSFNVGGVNYDTSSAEAAIASIRQRTGNTPANSADTAFTSPGLSSPISANTPRTSTPRPQQVRREDSRAGSALTGGAGTPSTGKKEEVPVEELEKYFASLMKKGGGGSQSGTPSRG